MDIKQKIGKRIKELRALKGFSQEELAARADIDRTYVNSVENGKRNISIVNIEKLVNALGLSFQEFFRSDLFIKKTDK
jgi:transcriptional regulator with XRE-family HTH domain